MNTSTQINTYLIPTTAPYAYNPYDYIYMVYAGTSEEAYNIAKEKLSGYCCPQYLEEYEYYPVRISNIPQDIFYKSQKYDILYSLLQKTKGAEHMAYFNINWNDYTNTLVKLAQKESWSNETYPDNKILTNYMVHTYKKLSSEKNIITNKEYGLFNTGLFTEFYQPIYAYHDKDGLQFLTAYELGNMNIADRPPKANYF